MGCLATLMTTVKFRILERVDIVVSHSCLNYEMDQIERFVT